MTILPDAEPVPDPVNGKQAMGTATIGTIRKPLT